MAPRAQNAIKGQRTRYSNYSPAFLGVSDPRNCRSAGRLLFHVSMSVRSEWSSSSLVRLRPAGLCRPNKWLSAALFCFSFPAAAGTALGPGPGPAALWGRIKGRELTYIWSSALARG